MIKFRLLREDEIECKVKKVVIPYGSQTPSGIIVLLYKTARTDMDLLDETVGPENWTDDYKEIKGNLYCGIGVRTTRETDGGAPYDDWVWKWDCGIESREDGEGNQKKGEASDAFKRAGFRWGIGRELYTAPSIFIPAEKVRISGKKTYDKFSVEKIVYDDNRKICALSIRNDSIGKRAFVWQRQ